MDAAQRVAAEGEPQLSLELETGAFSGSEGRSPKMRRVAAMLAPAATDGGAIVNDEASLDIADALREEFAAADPARGLSLPEIVSRLRSVAPPAKVEERLRVFRRLGFIRPLRDKKHQQRYVLDPAGVVGLRVIERFGERGGVEQLLVQLDRLTRQVAAGVIDPAELRAEMSFCRSALLLMQGEVRRLVADATLTELIDERRLHDPAELIEKVRELNAHVDDALPELHSLAWQLVDAAQEYEDAANTLLARLLDEGGEQMAFELLDPEDYRAAALMRNKGELAEAVAHVAFDPARPLVQAVDLDQALSHYRPHRAVRERPPEPVGERDPDPVGRFQELRQRRERRRILRAEQFLQGDEQVELLSTLRGAGWRATGSALGDLLQLDFDPRQPYALRFTDGVLVDPEGALTYGAPTTLARGDAAPDVEPQPSSEIALVELEPDG